MLWRPDSGHRDDNTRVMSRFQLFERYIGIDYSGAETPTSSLKGLRVYMSDQTQQPVEVQPPPSPRKYWTRQGIADWLVERFSENMKTLAGIDHGFSFPLRYFEVHHLLPDWPTFLDDFQHHWPTGRYGGDMGTPLNLQVHERKNLRRTNLSEFFSAVMQFNNHLPFGKNQDLLKTSIIQLELMILLMLILQLLFSANLVLKAEIVEISSTYHNYDRTCDKRIQHGIMEKVTAR